MQRTIQNWWTEPEHSIIGTLGPLHLRAAQSDDAFRARLEPDLLYKSVNHGGGKSEGSIWAIKVDPN